jgi:hypothetical protein
MNPKKLIAPVYSYTEQDAQKAFKEWGANCGPGALAVMVGLTLDDVHPHIPKFDERRYTSPSMMKRALESLGVNWHERLPREGEALLRGLPRSPETGAPDNSPHAHTLAEYGLVRIQWEGPWYGKFACRKSHWIGSMLWSGGNTFVFDINGGWLFQPEWEKKIVPILTGLYRRATGGWHATHRWELDFPAAK